VVSFDDPELDSGPNENISIYKEAKSSVYDPWGRDGNSPVRLRRRAKILYPAFLLLFID